ncbi:MAG: magnesium transporter [Christensenellales bacterium]|nr:magnesium transporter [Christensenellales bacterium]
MRPLEFEKIKDKLDSLLHANKKAELRGALIMLNEVDIAEYLESLDNERMLVVFRLLPKDISTDVFAYMDNDQRTRIMEALGDAETMRIIDEMFIDDAVDFLEELPAGVVKRMLINCDEKRRELLNQFLRYPENSAGSIMTIEYAELHAGMTVAQAMNTIRRTAPDRETINTLYVLDDRRELLGTLALRKLLLAEEDRFVDDMMDTHVISVRTTDDQEQVADCVRKYDLLSIPVVDHENRLVGIITVDDIMDVIEEENTEDFEKMAAMLPSDEEYLKTSVLKMAKNRLPWLMMLMFSATLTGNIITHFENVLSSAETIGVALVSCIPMLMDTGGNCGSQVSTLAIRGLALGQIEFRDIWRVLWKEVRVATIVGLALGVANYLRILYLTPYTQGVAMVVSLAIFFTVLLSKAIGCTLPLLARAIHLDPALMASPIITTVVDAASLLVLFSIATQVFHIAV